MVEAMEARLEQPFVDHFDGDVLLFGLSNRVSQCTGYLRAIGNQQALGHTSLRTQGFTDSIATIDEFCHVISLVHS